MPRVDLFSKAWPVRPVALALAALAISAASACATGPALPMPATANPIQLSSTIIQTADGPQRWVVARLDLARLDLEVTPGTGRTPDEFVARTTTAALSDHPRAALAVNASFYAVPRSTPAASPPAASTAAAPTPGALPAGQLLDAVGLVIAQGRQYSAPAPPTRIVDGVLCIAPQARRIAQGPDCGSGTLREAVAAGPVLMLNGAKVAQPDPPTDFATRRHPRSAIALSADAATAWIVVVDGRQTDSVGATLPELAGFIAALGAHSALNLDGGGSTALALRAVDGSVRLLNTPIDAGIAGRERAVATHLLVVPARN
jgi:exopolysaccharide biosynthesis protein